MKIRNVDLSIVSAGPESPAVDDRHDAALDEHAVRARCREVLAAAVRAGQANVMLPALGCGEDGGFPAVGAAKIAAQEVLRAAVAGGTLREIRIPVRDSGVRALFEKQVYGYLRHVMDDLAWGPYVTTDIIIEIDGGIVVIERTNPPFGDALPGGFVDRGESLEAAAVREAREETALDLADLRQFHTYSDPRRDPRFHTVTAVFTARGIGVPQAGDDAKGLRVVPLADLRSLNYAFDHRQVIEDYLRARGL